MRYKLPESKQKLLQRVGNIAQIAGLKRYYFAEGKAAGIEAVDVRTGTGFEFTVLPGRGMDLGWCGFEGMPVSYLAKAGLTSPVYFESSNKEWLRSFPGGLLSTCGLGNVGNSCEDEVVGIGPQHYGLHGRISSQSAGNVCVNQFWEGDSLKMEVAGTVTEAQLLGEHFSLRRTVSTELGQNCLRIRDVITNEDFQVRSMMVMYHINLGYPLIGQHSRVVIRGDEKFTDDRESLDYLDESAVMTEPIPGRQENLYFYKTRGVNGQGFAAIINDEIETAVYIRYSAATLPFLTEWKMMGEVDYVVGLEPGNCIPRGRQYHKDRKILQMMKPQEQIVNELEIGIVTGQEEMAAMLVCEECNESPE